MSALGQKASETRGGDWRCLSPALHATVCRRCGRCKCYVHKPDHRFDPVPKQDSR